MAGRQCGDKALSGAKISRKAALAQSVEHRIRNAGVACSSHAGGTIFIHSLREWIEMPRRRERQANYALRYGWCIQREQFQAAQPNNTTLSFAAALMLANVRHL